MNKKAMEFSASYLIALILAILFFSLAVPFGLKMMKGAEEYSTSLSEQTEAQIEGMLDTGHESVVMPFKTKNVMRDEMTLFGLGIRNVVSNDKQFKITVSFNAGKSNPTTRNDCGGWIKTVPGADTPTLKKDQKRIISIGILPPKDAAGGTCAYDVKVCYNDNVAGNDANCYAAFPDFYSETLLITAALKS